MSQRLNHYSEDEALTRAAIVAEARSWLGTPWHHAACVKNVGVDCAHFLKGVYINCALIEDFTIDHYPPDWNLHRDPTGAWRIFLNTVERFCTFTEEPQIGDVAMFRYGRQPAHGAILFQPDLIIHAYRDEGCVTLSRLSGSPLADRLVGYWRWKGF